MKNTYKTFSSLKNKIHKLPEFKNNKVSYFQKCSGFVSRGWYVIKLMFVEKEMFVFVLLQFVAIALAYYLWVQMLAWIPDEVWEGAKDSDDGSVVDLVLLVWTFLCVGMAALPLGIFSGCMGAAHILKQQTGTSTIASCLKIVLPNTWGIWLFSWVDGWITVNQIFDRLPRKNDRRTLATRLEEELIYYAWKVGTLGVLPALVTGRTPIQSVKDGVLLVKNHTKDVMILRGGYSILCWVVGIGGYIGSMYFMLKFPEFFQGSGGSSVEIFSFYMLIGIPLLISIALVLLFLRPIYIVSSFMIYSEFLSTQKQDQLILQPVKKATSALVTFLILCLGVWIVYVYREPLGIMDLLSVPYGGNYFG